MRALFVSRERLTLPLSGATARKWDAIGSVLDCRVLAAAADGRAADDGRFRLVRETSPLAVHAALPFRVARELRSFRPEVVVAQSVNEGFAVVVARGLVRSRARLVLEVHGDWRQATRAYGSPLRRLLNPVGDLVAAIVLARADAVRTISADTSRLVAEHGITPAATFPTYLDSAPFVARDRRPLPAAPTAVFVGTLERVKGFDTLVEAWPLVQQRMPEARLRIAGSGALAPLAAGLAEQSGGRVDWLGRVELERVAELFDQAWALVLPSRSEGFGRVVVEAAWRGRATVGGARGGIRDLVRDGETGVLVDPGDAPRLADAIVSVLSDRDRTAQLGEAARAGAEQWIVAPEEFAAQVERLVRGAVRG